jgi:hypothetical protein
MTEPLTPDAVRALLAEAESEAHRWDADLRDLVRRLAAALAAAQSELDATDVDVEWIESTFDRGKTAGAAALRKALLAHVKEDGMLDQNVVATLDVSLERTDDEERVERGRNNARKLSDWLWRNGYHLGSEPDVALIALHALEALASRTVETAEEWEKGVGIGGTGYIAPTGSVLGRSAVRNGEAVGRYRRHPRINAGPWEPVPPTPEEGDRG